MNRASSCAWPISRGKNRGPYSRSSATSTDPFGHKWQIATPDVSPAEMQRRWSATLA